MILCTQGPKGTAHQDMQIKKKGSGGVFSTNCKSKTMDKWECAGVRGSVWVCTGMCGNVCECKLVCLRLQKYLKDCSFHYILTSLTTDFF